MKTKSSTRYNYAGSNDSEKEESNHPGTPAVSIFIRYARRLKLSSLLGKIKDPRKGKITYSLETILSTAFATVLFRCESKNAFFNAATADSKSKSSIGQFCQTIAGCGGKELPNSKTVDDVLVKLNLDSMNDLLIGQFEQIRLSKVFHQYSDLLLPLGRYCFAIDGEVIHRYTPDSSHECENCPYCLKRQRGDTIWYHHVIVVASLVCPGGIKIPLYCYPIHAKALESGTSTSDENLKQECESKALPKIMAVLKKRFPRLKMCILLDALYANGPTIDLLTTYRVDFLIVRKKGNMTTVGEDCDGLGRCNEHRKSNLIHSKKRDNKGYVIIRDYKFFNEIPYQQHNLNLLRFTESRLDSNGNKKSGTHWEWISSWKLTKKKCEPTMMVGRLRWYEEDLFNTVENRGFNICHDYSRDPNAQMVWVILIMMAAAITECFVRLREIVPRLGKSSIRAFLVELIYQLKLISEEVIFGAASLATGRQLRYHLPKPDPW